MGQGSSSGGLAMPDVALHVLRVAEFSPGAQAGLEAFFDYLIGVELIKEEKEEIALSLDPEELGRVLEENEGREIGLRVYNAKTQRTRCKCR
jgi:hypothetical protein